MLGWLMRAAAWASVRKRSRNSMSSGQHFDRDETVEGQVAGLPHHGHSALADFAKRLVSR